MAEFRMPMLGADMEAGTLVQWKVKPGDTVHRGDLICEVETQKGVVDVEVWQDGKVVQLVVPEGQKVPVGTVLATLQAPGEAAPAPIAAEPVVTPPPVEAPAPEPSTAPEKEAVPGRRRVSPAARRIAEVEGVDVAQVKGTGPGGAVSLEDVERYLEKSGRGLHRRGEGQAKAPGVPQTSPAPAPVREATADGMRRAIAAAMSRSKREVPHYYLTRELDVTAALEWLAARNASKPLAERILPVALFVRAVAQALHGAPRLNGQYVDGAFRPSEAVHLGVAISQRGGGLIAPALHDVHAKSLDVLMQELTELIGRVRGGKLKSSELSDGTATLTPLLDSGADSVVGVIFPPQVCIVGVGRLRSLWAPPGESGTEAKKGAAKERKVVTVSLSGDHRVSDGLDGGRFLVELDALLQQPGTERGAGGSAGGAS